MPDRSHKPRDLNEMAAAIVESATGDEPRPDVTGEGKNPHAVALKRMGGKKVFELLALLDPPKSN